LADAADRTWAFDEVQPFHKLYAELESDKRDAGTCRNAATHRIPSHAEFSQYFSALPEVYAMDDLCRDILAQTKTVGHDVVPLFRM
jgi:hypothetical protein